jgi:hypothetical protein
MLVERQNSRTQDARRVRKLFFSFHVWTSLPRNVGAVTERSDERSRRDVKEIERRWQGHVNVTADLKMNVGRNSEKSSVETLVLGKEITRI